MLWPTCGITTVALVSLSAAKASQSLTPPTGTSTWLGHACTRRSVLRSRRSDSHRYTGWSADDLPHPCYTPSRVPHQSQKSGAITARSCFCSCCRCICVPRPCSVRNMLEHRPELIPASNRLLCSIPPSPGTNKSVNHVDENSTEWLNRKEAIKPPCLSHAYLLCLMQVHMHTI